MQYFTLAIFLNLLFSFSFVGIIQQTAQHEIGGKENKISRFLSIAPMQLKSIREQYTRWKKSKESLAEQENLTRLTQNLLAALLRHDSQFIVSYLEPDSLSNTNLQVLEFYDLTVLSEIKWYLQFLQKDDWDYLHASVDPKFLTPRFWNEKIKNFDDLRKAQLSFYQRILTLSQNVPAEFRRPFKTRFWQYDIPPIPEKGYRELQRRVLEKMQNNQMVMNEMMLIKALIDEQGKVLRCHVFSSSGNQQIDSLVVKIIQNMRWQPAKYEDHPFKTEVVLPLRLYHEKID
ncbi:MAG: energy transducer TonB [Calditrichaeota bacterium]|nr:MAG: energy transducer TonB [Calditrichota bacterium]